MNKAQLPANLMQSNYGVPLSVEISWEGLAI